MADTNQIKYISLDNVTLYDQLIKQYINSEDAKSLKTVMLSQDGKSLEFYRTSEPIASGAVPAYSITIPETNLDAVMKKVVSALSGHIGVFDANGQIIDGGIAISDLVTQADVEDLITEEVGKIHSLTTVVVEELPSDAEAKENVMYLIKDTTVSGSDKYQEWMKLQGTLQKIGDTSVNLDGYATQAYVNDRIIAEKANILADAASAAATADEQVLADAKQYADTKDGQLQDNIDAVDARVDATNTTVSNLTTTVNSHTDRIVALENSSINITVATESDIRALFAT